MKKALVYILFLMPAFAMAQAPAVTAAPAPAADISYPFTLQVKVGNLNAPAKAYLVYRLGANNVIDSTAIVSGNFDFTGTVLNPTNAILLIDHKGIGFDKLDRTADGLSFYIEKGVTSIATANDSVSKAVITGSQLNDDNKKLMAQLQPIQETAQKLYAEGNAATPEQQNSEQFNSSMEAKQKALQTAQTNIFVKFIKENPNSYLSLLVLSSMGSSTDVSVLEPLYNSLALSLKQMEPGKQIKKAINGLKPSALGALAPDFTQNDVNGKPVTLSSFRGKYVLLDFWASWCGPCRKENPNVVRAYNKFKTKNFTVLGVSLDKPQGKADWIAAIKTDKLEWTQVSDLNYWQNKAAALYAVSSIPHNFLIDPHGKIIAKDLRGSSLDEKLAQLFEKQTNH